MSEEQQQSDISDTLNVRIETLSSKQKKFLKAYGECGVVKYACQVARIHRSTFYDWRDRDENFKVCLPIFQEDAHDTLEYAAYEQGVVGVEEPVVSMGRVVMGDDEKPLTVRKYSPQLLITLLKANMPEKYREKQQVDMNANISGSLKTPDLSQALRTFTGEQLAQLKTWLLEAKAKDEQ